MLKDGRASAQAAASVSGGHDAKEGLVAYRAPENPRTTELLKTEAEFRPRVAPGSSSWLFTVSVKRDAWAVAVMDGDRGKEQRVAGTNGRR